MAKTTYKEWRFWVRKIWSDNGMKGWPDTEMRRFFAAGYSPLSAYELAKRRRHRQRPNADVTGLAPGKDEK